MSTRIQDKKNCFSLSCVKQAFRCSILFTPLTFLYYNLGASFVQGSSNPSRFSDPTTWFQSPPCNMYTHSTILCLLICKNLKDSMTLLQFLYLCRLYMKSVYQTLISTSSTRFCHMSLYFSYIYYTYIHIYKSIFCNCKICIMFAYLFEAHEKV